MFLFGSLNVKKLKDKMNIQGLIEAISKGSPVSEDAANALVSIGKPSVELLCTALNAKDKDVRKIAAESLGKINDSRAVEPLCAALKDSDFPVREAAAIALGKIGSNLAAIPLCAALQDDISSVRMAAVKALDRIGLPDNVMDKILYMIVTEYWNGIVSLGSDAVGPLCTALKNRNFRIPAAEMLGKIGDTRAVQPLCDTLMTPYDSDACMAAAEALSDIGDNRAVEPLCAALKDRDKRVRKSAAKALGKIGDSRGREPLCSALQDSDVLVRKAAAEALDKIGISKETKIISQKI